MLSRFRKEVASVELYGKLPIAKDYLRIGCGEGAGLAFRDFLDQAISLFLIDHDMGLVLNVCDYIYVLDFGQIISHGTPAEVRTDPAVIAAYLGESAGEAQAQDGATFGSTLTEEV